MTTTPNPTPIPDRIKALEARIEELEDFVEKAMSNPMIAGMLSDD